MAEPAQEVAQCAEQAEVKEVRQTFCVGVIGFSMFSPLEAAPHVPQLDWQLAAQALKCPAPSEGENLMVKQGPRKAGQLLVASRRRAWIPSPMPVARTTP